LLGVHSLSFDAYFSARTSLQRALKHTDLMAQSQVFQLEVNS